jgi:hypothetical protein
MLFLWTVIQVYDSNNGAIIKPISYIFTAKYACRHIEKCKLTNRWIIYLGNCGVPYASLWLWPLKTAHSPGFVCWVPEVVRMLLLSTWLELEGVELLNAGWSGVELMLLVSTWLEPEGVELLNTGCSGVELMLLVSTWLEPEGVELLNTGCSGVELMLLVSTWLEPEGVELLNAGCSGVELCFR